MDEEFIRNRITELRLKKGVSEYQMSMELGQNRSYIQAISSGRSMPSMKQFLNICEYFEITPLQFFDAQENNPQLTRSSPAARPARHRAIQKCCIFQRFRLPTK